MLKINLIAVGAIKETYLKLGINDYLQRLKPYVDITMHEIDETPVQNSQETFIQQALSKDAEKIIRFIPKQTYLIVMDIAGKQFDSLALAKKIDTIKSLTSSLTIVIGGSHGVDASLKLLAKEKWSFSPLTFPHQLFRLMLLEQLYRGMMILNHHPYHK